MDGGHRYEEPSSPVVDVIIGEVKEKIEKKEKETTRRRHGRPRERSIVDLIVTLLGLPPSGLFLLDVGIQLDR